ncbi:YceK/YidQ family lipoprotein [Pseudomonas sp. P115]|uniref:YceK/YidQ family lipoprotein n=1 Tax=Pseudomonas pisciculturae TaxID=2730413 RepID=UPI0018922769|nr:YceK/YidQ family lipoprotein [Pseudomonas pisciculturae]MBF6028095.1 YceK/YidQ family lipoprotein [Pseudomonas pisciculturae]
MKSRIAGSLALLGVSLIVAGCGTVTTVLREDSVTVQSLKAKKTYCQSVPRVYSGVSYDLCVLHAPPNSGSGMSLNDVPWPYLDVAVSSVLDTLLLPYTIYRQNADGSLELR